MNKNKNPFRLRTKSPRPQEAQQSKPTAELTDAELEDSLQKARRDLLDAQHAELREREKARVAPEDGGRPQRRNLGSIFGKNNRRFK
jgi:hypothetical protein